MAIGVLLLLVSSVVTVFLLGAESRSISSGVSEDRERDISPALSLAMSDIGNALNYAGMYAESEIGMSPVINASPGIRPGDSAAVINEGRLRSLTYHRLAAYLESNYAGNFEYGDYNVSARIDGDERTIEFIPLNMTLTRNLEHPLFPCRQNYAAYYVVTAPVRLTISKRGSDYTFTQTRTIRTLITSRYPLLESMTGEYEERLNGTVMTTDLTAASYAYTWARGYAQYTLGMPLNIVDNGDMALMANGANLLEQGFEFNSVDPISLASMVYHTSGADAHPSKLNNYSITNNSRKGLPENQTTSPPQSYNFTIDSMVDSAYCNVSFGGYAENCYTGAYQVYLFLNVTRDTDYYPRENRSTIIEESSISRMMVPFYSGDQVPLTRTFRVYEDNTNGQGFADRVTVNYVVRRYSSLEFYGQGHYMETASRLDDPLLRPAFNDVENPGTAYAYQKELSFGHKSFKDDNLAELITNYEESFDPLGETGSFNRTLYAMLDSRGRVTTLPTVYTNPSHSFVCGPDNSNPVWVEIQSDYEMSDLCKDLKRDIRVSLDPAAYGNSPSVMSTAAYTELKRQFDGHYDSYLDRPAYASTILSQDGSKTWVYKSCGSKAIFYIRRALLEDVRLQLSSAANLSASTINQTIDSRMNGTGLNSSNLDTGAIQSRNYLSNNFYIQFGLPMELNSSLEAADGYPWKESVTLAVDQSPDYLSTERYVDPETGYTTRPLKLRNICLFALPAGFLDTGKLSEAMAGPILDSIDTLAEAAIKTGNETVIAETNALIDNIAAGTKYELKKQIDQNIRADPEAGDSITKANIDQAVDDAYARRDNNASLIVSDLNNGKIQQEIADELVNASISTIEKKAHDKAEGYVDEYTDYVSRRVKDEVTRAGQTAIASVIDSLKGQVKSAVSDFSRAGVEAIARGSTEAALGQAMSKVPSGVPLLPPYGWWATMNIWYIEVQGDIPSFTVYDADNEAVPNPIFGHEAPCYTRRWQTVTASDGTVLGRNEPIRFCTKTCTFILVPPGPQGVGDKAGEWDEKSEGFEEAPTCPS